MWRPPLQRWASAASRSWQGSPPVMVAAGTSVRKRRRAMMWLKRLSLVIAAVTCVAFQPVLPCRRNSLARWLQLVERKWRDGQPPWKHRS